MNNKDIKAIMLANGYKEKLQADGTTDLNPYVYSAARTLLQLQNGRIMAEMSDLFIGSGEQASSVISSCIDVLQEFVDEITVIENSETQDD